MDEQVYGYVRLSRDDDVEKDSLEGQKTILEEHASKLGFKIIKIFEDNNCTGMNFNREGINEIESLVERNEITILIAKDLSRIGRHNALTLIFLEKLEQHNVRFITASDGIDTLKKYENDYIGIKAFVNEMYAKDISSKVLTVLHSKQQKGLVINVPYGYMRIEDIPGNDDLSKFTIKNNLAIDEEASEIVKLIFKLYIEGYGMKRISLKLNELNHKTPSVHKFEKFGSRTKKTNIHAHIWFETSIKRILTNECYVGVLRNAKTKLTHIKGKKKTTSKEEQIVHYNYYPPIISVEDFQLVQEVMAKRGENAISAGNQKIHKYAGVLECKECSKGFVARVYNNKQVSYECVTHRRYGKAQCTSHRINENELNEVILSRLALYVCEVKEKLKEMDDWIIQQKTNKKAYDNTISKLNLEISHLREEKKDYSRQLAKKLIEEDICKELIGECNSKIKIFETQLNEVSQIKISSDKMTENVISTVEVLDQMVESKYITNKHIQIMVNKIIVHETNESLKYNRKKLEIEIEWSKTFKLLFSHELARSPGS